MGDKKREAFSRYMASNDRATREDVWKAACQWQAQQAAGVKPQHSDDEAVDNFAAEMKAKLAQAREKGRGGWEDKEYCPTKRLTSELWFHMFKGNDGTFEDIANFAMMLHQRGDDPADLQRMADHLTLTIPQLENDAPQPPKAVPDIHVDFGELRRALGFFGIAQPESNEELGERALSYMRRVIKKAAEADAFGLYITDHPGPSTTAFDDQEAPDE